MRFEYDKNCMEEMILSSDEIKLIKSKAKELRKLCYQFGFFNFETMVSYVGFDKEENEFTYEEVANGLKKVLPFVEKYWNKLVEEEFLLGLLTEIEEHIHSVTVPVLDSPLSADDICEEITSNFDGLYIVEAFSKFSDRATLCKVYEYLKTHEDDED